MNKKRKSATFIRFLVIAVTIAIFGSIIIGCGDEQMQKSFDAIDKAAEKHKSEKKQEER